jgi:hypothetical protein
LKLESGILETYLQSFGFLMTNSEQMAANVCPKHEKNQY